MAEKVLELQNKFIKQKSLGDKLKQYKAQVGDNDFQIIVSQILVAINKEIPEPNP